MKTRHLLLLGRCVTLVLVAFVVVACDAPKNSKAQNTLVLLLDRPVSPGFEIPNADFFTSWSALEGLLQSWIAQTEMANARKIAKDLRVVVATGREGEHTLPKADRSVRAILKEFATVWNVAVLVDGNTILIADVSDVNRFPHDLAIVPEKP